MSALDTKLIRDFRRLWPQALAVACVLACGVATLILSIGAYGSLFETQQAFYERQRFGSLFASAVRAPAALEREIGEISGVLAVEARIVEPILLDIPGMVEPASGQIISLPETGSTRLNRPYIRAGRLPAPGRGGEVLISEAFSREHELRVGTRFSGLLAGRRMEFLVAGVALSPEFVYAIGPGDLVPDHRRFAILWMRRPQLAGLTDLDDSFNSVSVALQKGAAEMPAIDRLDQLLAPYGGTGAFGRKDQTSHAFLDNEMQELRAMARVIPPIFLLVSAFLVNMILSRLIALEREQIGLLKALGYGKVSIGVHYFKLVLAIACLGVLIGFLAGTWMGNGLTRLYGQFFNFPFLIFQHNSDVYLLAALVGILSALLGALKSVSEAVALPPAVAMQPAAPVRYRRATALGRLVAKLVSQLTVMALRHLVRWPIRSGLTCLGISLPVALLMTAMFSSGSVNKMIDTLFFRSDRQDANIAFNSALQPSAIHGVRQLPGVLAAEPYRIAAVDLVHGSRIRRLAITGKPSHGELSRLLDLDLKPVELPGHGLILTERVANHLNARNGDLVTVRLLEEGGHETTVPVVDVVQSYVGLGAYMELDALDRLSRNGPRLSGVYVELDTDRIEELYSVVKSTPVISSVSLRTVSLQKIRYTIERNIAVMTFVYTILAVIIAFGVVYNSARIQLSERARELASLRILGFTQGEVSRVLVVELAILTLVAQPVGWLLGYGFARAVVTGFQNDLFRIPFVVEPAAPAWASITVVSAAAVSAIIVLARVRRLDMIRVLKTRE